MWFGKIVWLIVFDLFGYGEVLDWFVVGNVVVVVKVVF